MWYKESPSLYRWCTLNRIFEDQLQYVLYIHIRVCVNIVYCRALIQMKSVWRRYTQIYNIILLRTDFGLEAQANGEFRWNGKSNGTILWNLCLQNALLPILLNGLSMWFI